MGQEFKDKLEDGGVIGVFRYAPTSGHFFQYWCMSVPSEITMAQRYKVSSH